MTTKEDMVTSADPTMTAVEDNEHVVLDDLLPVMTKAELQKVSRRVGKYCTRLILIC